MENHQFIIYIFTTAQLCTYNTTHFYLFYYDCLHMQTRASLSLIAAGGEGRRDSWAVLRWRAGLMLSKCVYAILRSSRRHTPHATFSRRHRRLLRAGRRAGQRRARAPRDAPLVPHRRWRRVRPGARRAAWWCRRVACRLAGGAQAAAAADGQRGGGARRPCRRRRRLPTSFQCFTVLGRRALLLPPDGLGPRPLLADLFDGRASIDRQRVQLVVRRDFSW